MGFPYAFVYYVDSEELYIRPTHRKYLYIPK